ncbi:MAG: hypothetical protein HC897_07500 [Thermoanaerobaculia bacterium]|nr:hypothetical protein [Thermoanaerobaculia bacterium]
MVSLGYRLSPAWRNQMREVNLRDVSANALHYDLFLGDVTFQSKGADFSACWGWVPVLDFASAMLRIVVALEHSGRQQLEFTESEAVLNFERSEDQVRISASYTSATAIVPYQDLRVAVATFAQKAVTELGAEFPELRTAAAFQSFERELLGSPGSC